MKGFLSPVLALFFAFYALISLLSMHPTWERGQSMLPVNYAKVSDLGLRFAFHK